MFQGTTLRSLLLKACGFSLMGQIALIGAIVGFVLAGMMAHLVTLGVIHARRTNEETELFGHKVRPEPALVAALPRRIPAMDTRPVQLVRAGRVSWVSHSLPHKQ